MQGITWLRHKRCQHRKEVFHQNNRYNLVINLVDRNGADHLVRYAAFNQAVSDFKWRTSFARRVAYR